MKDDLLQVKFLRLYDLFHYKELNVKQMLEVWNQYRNGNLQLWRRSLRHWEKEMEDILEGIINNINLSNGDGVVKWALNKGSYSTAEVYKILMGEPNDNHNPWF